MPKESARFENYEAASLYMWLENMHEAPLGERCGAPECDALAAYHYVPKGQETTEDGVMAVPLCHPCALAMWEAGTAPLRTFGGRIWLNLFTLAILGVTLLCLVVTFPLRGLLKVMEKLYEKYTGRKYER